VVPVDDDVDVVSDDALLLELDIVDEHWHRLDVVTFADAVDDVEVSIVVLAGLVVDDGLAVVDDNGHAPASKH
jgi:hypothetical protein